MGHGRRIERDPGRVDSLRICRRNQQRMHELGVGQRQELCEVFAAVACHANSALAGAESRKIERIALGRVLGHRRRLCLGERRDALPRAAAIAADLQARGAGRQQTSIAEKRDARDVIHSKVECVVAHQAKAFGLLVPEDQTHDW